MSASGSHAPGNGARTWSLALAALGIVYGDIGTSPLYAVKECFTPHTGLTPTHDNVVGVLSLFTWSLILVVSVKYLSFVLKADNKGEGGIFAMMALIPSGSGTRMRTAMLMLGLFGAALLYGDGIITPAISVLSAVEGLQLAGGHPPVVPVTLAILVGLFFLQRRGTAGIGKLFGPVMVLWFLVLGVLGLRYIAGHPAILTALNPWNAVRFFSEHGFRGFVVLGSVVLCITGGEALYADMGHFGTRPIRINWYAVVLPALMLNYYGQGALLLHDPAAVGNPFYGLVPPELLYPMVGLSTVAAVIASQAMISGAFSLTRQAVQLGYCPRVTIVHTSGEQEGQIFIPEINWAMMTACLWLVVSFQQSSRLASAYGIAVTGSMTITSIVFFVVSTQAWQWPAWKAGPLVALFLSLDLPFFGANLLKFVDGGWFPIAVAAFIFTLMTTWFTGRRLLSERFQKQAMPLELFLDDVKGNPPPRVPGTAVFMAASAYGTPPVLLHHLKHNKVLHEQVVLLSVAVAEQPTVPVQERVLVEELGAGFFRVVGRYGFMQSPSVPEVMAAARREGLRAETNTTSFYLGRE
ncbi:MAG: KUP/HAK/KT family potassium transporter, partial [Deltaproteobacteria bacterium]|nr:KUP/HAK/KT family potassium transporter [Deltaproteobacteria bacterium]